MKALRKSVDSRNRFEKHPKRVLFLFSFLVLILIDLLLGLIFLGKWSSDTGITSVPNAFYHHERGVQPMGSIYVKWGGKGTRQGYTETSNSFGFKDSVPRKVEAYSSLTRVLFLGDSFTAGSGLSFDSNFANLFWEKVGKDRYEILDAGVSSYSPKLYYLKLKYLLEVVHLRLDYVIVFIDQSDTQDEIVYERYKPKDPILLRQFFWFMFNHSFVFHECYLHVPAFQDWLNFERNNLKFGDYDFQKNYERDRIQWQYDANVYRLWGQRGLELGQENMDRLFELCQEKNIKLLLAVYPWPEDIIKNNSKSQYRLFWKKYAGERHIPLLDLYETFLSNSYRANREKYFIEGDVHWNEEGHHVVADKLFQFWKNRRR